MVSSVFGQQPKDFVVNVITTNSENPASISFTWDMIPGDSVITIHRKSKGAMEWGNALATLPADATTYTDNSIEIGVEYEYRIQKRTPILYPYTIIDNFTNLEQWKEEWWDVSYDYKPIITYLSAGIKLPEVEHRGKVILLVDSSFVDSLRNELNLFETDLLGDGWKVLRKDISRNTSVKYVKSVVRDFYYSDTVNVKSLILFGHIPVPYSGCTAVDGHLVDLGAWQADQYYGSMKEEIWTDEIVDIDTVILYRRSENNNIPGDGKFDLSVLPLDENIVLQIGRIDLSKMPAFQVSEAELLKNYINKDHNFRHKRNNPKLQALIRDGHGCRDGWCGATGPLRNFTALVTEPNIQEGEFFTDGRTDSYMFSYANGFGDGPFLGNLINGVGHTNDFVNYSVKIVFISLFSSCTGLWDYPDNFLRASLASKGWSLTCIYDAWPYHIYHMMGMGETIGYGVRTTQNNIDTYDFNSDKRGMHVNLLGDPTLRMHIVCPVNSLQSTITADSSVMLAWKPADDSIIGYHVYKLDTTLNEYNKITSEPITDTWFEDTLPDAGNNYYMVKTFKLSEVTSGSYYNLSQGIFDTINYVQQTPVPVSGIDLSINPGSIQPLKIYDPFKIDAEISPANATNKLLKWAIENITGNGKFDVNGEILADKGGTIAIVAEALDGSGITGRLEVTVDGIPDAAGLITGEASVCRDGKRKLYTVPEIRGVSSYIWTLPSGEIDTISINEVEYVMDNKASSGNIKVRGHNPYADGDESTLYVTIKELPPKPEITLVGNVLHSNASSGNQWYIFPPTTLIEGATDSIYTPAQEGRYFVKVTLDNCTSPSSNMIPFPATIIDIIDFTNETVIYPNPSAGQFTISFGTIPSRQATVKVFSLQGRLVYSETLQNTAKATIDLTAFTKGIYIINVITDKTIYYGKICLE